MFHAAAKILFFVLQPSSLMFLATAVGVGLIHRRPVLGRRLAAGGLAAMLLAGLSPVGNVLILPLEQRFPVPALDERTRVTGIILLGGFEDGWVSAARGSLAVNEAAERLTEGLRLARRHPDARVVFTGGVGGLMAAAMGERDATPAVARFLADAGGIARDRIVLEGRSRDTYENAAFTRDLIAPKAGETWLLVTSAYHMPRAMGVFRAAGFPVTAYPVDFRTRGSIDALRLFERIPAGLERFDLAAKEWLGLVAYRLSGRTTALFPGP